MKHCINLIPILHFQLCIQNHPPIIYSTSGNKIFSTQIDNWWNTQKKLSNSSSIHWKASKWGETSPKIRGRNENLCRSLFSSETSAIKKEGNGLRVHGLAVTVCMHQLLQCGCALDPEENLSTILHITFSHTSTLCEVSPFLLPI